MKTLQELFPDKKIMTIKECFVFLGWTSENGADSKDTGPITCFCGEKVKTGGWFGTEHAWCPACHSGMQNLLGVLPVSNNSVTLVTPDVTVPEDGRYWIPENVWGF